MAEWVAKSTVIHDPGRGRALDAYVDVYSDHAAVWSSFFTDRDDD